MKKGHVRVNGRTLSMDVVRTPILCLDAVRYRFAMGVTFLVVKIPKIATLVLQLGASSPRDRMKTYTFPPEKIGEQAVHSVVRKLLHDAMAGIAEVLPARKRKPGRGRRCLKGKP